MKLFMTSGTFDFLKNMKLKHKDQHLILLHNGSSTKLIQEAEKKTLFKEPRKFDIVITVGNLIQEGFIVMNNVPVTEEGRPTFEHMFKNRVGEIEKQPGFIAFRVLRPIKSETYIILTQWDSENSFNNWKKSSSFFDAHSKQENQSIIANPQKLFTGESFVSKYYVPTFDEE
ncbi:MULTISPECIES: antibiotic biosynthesis monooxygenase family protein [Bacillus]|uniref:antibiotic biosynthesis monooxygenase family protein n=1 Tax=Bacillus TaxID=1386 RepID=UPI00030D979F|nr:MULTISPECIES: antibiotic biosynthesis monooxygenase [Bacillus]